MIKKIIPRIKETQKFRPKNLLKINGIKKVNVAGIPINILFANAIDLLLSPCSTYEKNSAMIVVRGKAIINPAKCGFLFDNQLAKDITTLEIRILVRKDNIFS